MNGSTVLAPGVILLAQYRPEKFDLHVINDGIVGLTARLGLEPYPLIVHREPFAAHGILADPPYNSQVRDPECHKDGYDQSWHRDWNEGMTQPDDFALVLWASVSPTEIMRQWTGNTEVIQPNPFDVVLIRNNAVLHRIPRGYNTDRWFFRQYVKWPYPIKGE